VDNGMTRLVAAVEGRRADRIPVFCNLLDQGAPHLGMSSEEYFSRGEHVATAQLELRERYGYDNVWSLAYVGKEAEFLGCKDIAFAPDGPPNVRDFVLKTPADIEALEVPTNLADTPAFEQSAACLKLLRDEVGGRYPICAYLTGSMTLPALLMGMDKWMELLLLGPASLRDDLLTKCSDFYDAEARAYRAAGADVLLYANGFGSTDFLPKRLFDALALPWMKRDFAPGGVDGVVYYAGTARLNPVLNDVVEQLDIRAFYLSPFDDLTEARQRLGDRGLLSGVLNDIPIADFTPEQVRDEVTRIIQAGKVSERFLFGTAVMPLNIPEANIRALMEAALANAAW